MTYGVTLDASASCVSHSYNLFHGVQYAYFTSGFTVKTSFADFPVRVAVRPHNSSGPVFLDDFKGVPTFSQENSPVIIPCGAQVSLDQPLTLTAGTVLLFGEGAELRLRAGIHGLGTATNPVTIGMLTSCCQRESVPRANILGGTSDLTHVWVSDVIIDCSPNVVSVRLDSSEFHGMRLIAYEGPGKVHLDACNIDSASTISLESDAPPDCFSLLQPAFLDEGMVSFVWTKSACRNPWDRVKYAIFLDTVSTMSSKKTVWQGFDTTAILPLEAHRRWFWMVTATDSLFNSRQAGTASFATGIQAVPPPVVLLSPLDSTRIAADSIILKWQQEGEGETFYWLETSECGDFSVSQRDSAIIRTSTVVRGVKGSRTTLASSGQLAYLLL